MKILTAIFAFIIVAMVIVTGLNGIFDWESMWFFLKIAIPIFLFVYLVGFLSYRLYAYSLDGVYHVLFEMDEDGISHIPMRREREYSRKVGLFSMLVGLFTRNVGQMGSGLYVTTLENIRSSFDRVVSIRTDRKHDLINVNQVFLNNQIYAGEEDYDFVLEYIVSRCPKAKVTDR